MSFIIAAFLCSNPHLALWDQTPFLRGHRAPVSGVHCSPSYVLSSPFRFGTYTLFLLDNNVLVGFSALLNQRCGHSSNWQM